MYKLFAPLNAVLNQADWPTDLFQSKDGGSLLDRIYLVEFSAAPAFDNLTVHLTVAFKGELELVIPGLDGTSLAFVGSQPTAVSPITPEPPGPPDLEGDDDNPIEGEVPDTGLEAEWIALALTFTLADGAWSLTVEDVTIELRFPPDMLRPADGSGHAHLSLRGDIILNNAFDVKFQGFDAVDLSRCEIAQTGIIISANGVKLDLSRTSSQPEIIAAGFDESFLGVYIGEAKVELPKDFPALAPADLVLKKCAIGSGGVSGKLEAHYHPHYDQVTKTFTGNGAGTLFGIPFGLKDIELEFKQNAFQKSEIKGELLLPFFDEPVEVDIGLSLDGGFSVALTSTGPNGLKKLTKPGVLEIELDSIGFELKDGVFLAKLSGQITPLFGANKGLNWPGFKVEELSIDSKGHVHLQGGWLALREQYNLDFHGFHIGITKLGFGKTEDGGKWVGFSGELKLVDGFTAGASVEGLRITWYDDGRDTKISFNGIGVEFKIPDVLYFKGFVAYQELEVNGASVHRFDGDIKLSLISLKLEIDAKLVVGSASGGPEGNYNFFAIYLGVELPTGIPLSPTPLALYGMAGLFALQMEPNKLANEEWYEGWFQRPVTGITDLKSKWVNRRGSFALGGGVTIGTAADNGFTFACKALLVFVFPGPIILLEGKANLLKERAKLNDDPMFRSLAVLDMRQGQILMGLDAKYQQDDSGKVIDIRAGVEAFFAQDDWHIYMGEKEPRSKRIRARILSLFEANSYFMLGPKQLATGAWVGYARQWKFGPVSLTLEAWLEGNVVVNWTPLHFHGDLWLHGNIEVKVFGFGLGLSVDARFAADVFDPFHVLANFEVTVKLPKPLKKKHFEITLEWGPIPKWPERFPLPLKEVAIEHFKVTTSWPLPKNGTPPLLSPKYDQDREGLRSEYPPPDYIQPPVSTFPIVPLDCRPHLSFGRSVHDDALVGVNPQVVQPDYEWIGDPDRHEGPVKVRYGLKEIELAKLDQRTNLWQPVARMPAASGVPTLYGSWAAVPQLPAGTGQVPAANVKFWVWSRTPFDYTRHGGSDWDNGFLSSEAFSTYPCVPQDVPEREVCVDFEKLDSAQLLQSPWQVPEHPEVTVGWQAPPRQQVTRLDPPVDGFTHALSFPALVSACLPPAPADLSPTGPPNPSVTPGVSGPTLPNTVTIKLSTPANHVTFTLAEAKPDQACLDFRTRAKGNVKLPLIEQGVTIGPKGSTKFAVVKTTLGDLIGLDCTLTAGEPLEVVFPCPATSVELMLTSQPLQTTAARVSVAAVIPSIVIPAPTIEAYNSAGEKIGEKPLLNPALQPEIIRFEGNDLKKIKVNPLGVKISLHKLCFLCAASPTVMATAFDASGAQVGTFASLGNVVEVAGNNLTRVQLTGTRDFQLLKFCTRFGPDPREVALRQEMAQHLRSEVARWQQTGEVLEPFSAYRLKIVTTIDAQGTGPIISGSKYLTQTEYAHFRTEGPPGLTKLSLPPGRDAKDADKFDSGLEDLTRYVRQTMPVTVPAEGEKPLMAKPFYRAYDVDVEFNEDYVDLMYRMSGRDLGLYLYDNNNRPVRDAEGRLLIQSGDWGAVEDLTLTEGEQHWLALSNSANHCLPLISTDTIAHDKKLTSAVADRTLEPDTIYEARLIPLLLREGFRNYAAGTAAPGPSGKLGRWEVHDEGDSNAPSRWEVRETVAPIAHYLTQTSSIKGGNNDPTDPFKPGTMLLLGNDPSLDAGHLEQPANWTDYRLSVYLRATAGGAMGLVFRYRNGNSYYRFSLDRNGNYRRLVSVVNGLHAVLAQDDFAYELDKDYLISIEAIGPALRVYQDGALVFEVNDAAQSQGSVGLYCHDNPGVRFNDVRVDDFRQTAPVVYRFQLTTSLFANFFHQLHSYQDETWRIAVEGVASAGPAMLKAVSPSAPPTDEEARGYETLATAVLGPAARQNPPEVQISRVEIDGAALAFLVQSPEPIDWLRTDLALLRTSLARTEPALPGEVKLAAVNFAANRIDIDSVVLLLRESMNLTGYKIESRLVTWPVSLDSGVVIDAQTLPARGLAPPVWATYREFEAEKTRGAGAVLQTLPNDSVLPFADLVGVDAGNVDLPRRIFYSVELRIVAPDGRIIHARHFLPDADYSPEDVNVLRKADGTGFFMFKPDDGSSGTVFSPAQFRLKLTYRRDNKAHISTSQTLSQAGNRADEVVTLDIPLQGQ